jgi:uncharacterized protein YjbI with pentapeptide repeats
LARSNLSQSTLVAADLHGAVLLDSNLSLSQFTDANLSGADLTNADLNRSVLIGTDLTGSNLADGNLSLANLTDARLMDADLTRVNLQGATLTGARFDGAMIAGARLGYATLNDFTKEQLYATASYRIKNLSAITLAGNDLRGWSFTGQNLSFADLSKSAITRAHLDGADLTGANLNKSSLADAGLIGASLSGATLQSSVLTNARLSGANLSQADLTGADLRNASDVDLTGALVSNLIRPDGTVISLSVAEGDRFLVRDYDGDPIRQLPPLPVSVEDSASFSAGGVLQLNFETDAWDSLISFEPGTLVELGGTLEFTFADDVDVVSQIGRTISIFDWSGVDPTGAFTVSSRYPWDVTQLYTTGEVTLLLPGDTNGDGVVSIKDFNNVVNNFGGTGQGDTNGDQLVNLIDLNNVRNFFRVSSSRAVSEPSTFVLLVVAVGGAALRARGFHRW